MTALRLLQLLETNNGLKNLTANRIRMKAMTLRKGTNSPRCWGVVTANTDFQWGGTGEAITARAMISDASGTIEVITADGKQVNKTILAGLNVFTCKQVVNTGGLTLEWLE